MRSLRSLSLVAVLAVAVGVATAPRPARAQFAEPLSSGIMIIAGGMLVLGADMFSDVFVGGSLAANGWAPRPIATLGLITWSITGAYFSGAMVEAAGQGSFDPVLLGGTLISAASVGLSLYGLAHGPPEITVTPAAIPLGHDRVAPALSISGHF